MLHELPATIYIGLGAIVAAIITALISFANLITSKDQNISDHRQLWINSIREDISKFIGLSFHISSIKSRYAKLKTEAENEEETTIIKKNIYSITPEFAELLNRIILRLNSKDNQNIITALKSISNELAGKWENPESDSAKVELLTSDLRDSSQEMLKQEWKRVKRGELSYLITKWAFIILIASSIGFGIYQLNNHTANTELGAAVELPNKALKRN